MSSMFEIYGLPIAASGLLAAVLGVMGALVAARDRAMQTLCIAQGAMFGVLLGIGIVTIHDQFTARSQAIVPFGSAILGACLTFCLSEAMVKRVEASRNTYFAALFAVLMAAGHLASALFPGLESHMTQRYFGDLAVITDSAAWTTIGAAGIVGLILALAISRLTRSAFFENMLGTTATRSQPILHFAATLMILAVISFSIQVTGLLFTVTALFVPTSILSQLSGGYRNHLTACAVVAFASTTIGFLVSLTRSDIPTVPLVSLCMILFGVLAMVVHRTRTVMRA